MNWKEITECAREGFKIGQVSWHKSEFWPVDNTGDVVVGNIGKFNPAIFNNDEWIILVDSPAHLKSIFNDDCYERLDKLNDTYREIVDKLKWFVGPGKVTRNPMLVENFEMFIQEQLREIGELGKEGV